VDLSAELKRIDEYGMSSCHAMTPSTGVASSNLRSARRALCEGTIITQR
jgi:hypothetical protein